MRTMIRLALAALFLGTSVVPATAQTATWYISTYTDEMLVWDEASEEIVDRIPLQKRLGPPVLAGVALACSNATAWLLPLPQETKETPAVPAPVEKPETQSDR